MHHCVFHLTSNANDSYSQLKRKRVNYFFKLLTLMINTYTIDYVELYLHDLTYRSVYVRKIV
jgi:hypothetical protein